MLRYTTFAALMITALVVVTLAPGTPPVSSASVNHVTTHDTFETDELVVALTFDVTFDRGQGERVLDILRDYGVVSTWAITGVWAENNPDLMRRIANEGHHLINHTWHHFSLTGDYTGSTIHEQADPLSYGEVIEQLERTDELVMAQTGVSTRPYIRPPYGDYDEQTLVAFADAGYTENIMWTVDTYGWYGHPAADVQQRALQAAQPGANILMHIGHGSTDVAALTGIIEGFRELGYGFATVEDFLEGRYADPATRFQAETGNDLAETVERYRVRIDRQVWSSVIDSLGVQNNGESSRSQPTRGSRAG